METQPTKENKPSKLDKLVKISIIAGALITALSITYYLVIFLPQKEKVRIEMQGREQEKLEELRKECAEWALNKATNNKTTGYQQDAYDDYFDRCLREKGL